VLRRPAIYAAAVVVGVAALAAGLPWWAAIPVAIAALLGGAGIAAWMFAVPARPPGAHAAPTLETRSDDAPGAVFRLEGEYWTIAFQGSTFRLVDSKGLRYIHRLLGSPGIEVYALDLESAFHPGSPSVPAVDRGEALRLDVPSPDLLVDRQALDAYRRRVEDLRDQIEEADRNGDDERASRAREELEYLVEEIGRVTGRGGSPRARAGETERARVNVTRAIRKAIERIREQDRSLGHHLDHDIRTGTFCIYLPDPAAAPDWAL